MNTIERITYPLLDSQMGVALECIKYPDSREYELINVATLSKAVEYERLNKALDAIIRERKELRTRFVMIDGELRQYADEDMRIPLLHSKMSEEEFQSYKHKATRVSFDILAGKPLLRAEFVETETNNYFLFTIHHCICDGFSILRNFCTVDMPAAYAGEPLQHCDYGLYEHAEAENAWYHSDSYEAARKHYEERFKEADFVTLAKSNNNPVGNELQVVSCISQEMVDAWSNTQGIHSSMLFQAAFTLMLSRVCRTDCPGYFSVTHGRHGKPLDAAYGMFVQSIPVSVSIHPEETVRELITATRTEHKDTISKGVFPFTHFCRDMNVAPRLCFSFQGGSIQEHMMLDGVTYPIEQLPLEPTHVDMRCVVYVRDGNYEMRFLSSEAQNDAATLQLMADGMTTVVQRMMLNPDMPLKDICIVSDEEKEHLMTLAQGETVPDGGGKTLVDLFTEQAARTPDNICVVFREKRYTYRDIDRLSTRLAVLLQQQYGVKPETIVGVLIERSELMLVYPLAIMKAGGAYMPLDLHFPADRLQFMCDDAGVNLILSEDNRVADTIPQYEGRVITSEVLDHIDSIEGSLDNSLKATPDNMFVILFTSGSTGVPKGVVLDHKNIVNYCHGYATKFSLTATDRVLAYANFSFDAHMLNMYPAISVGASAYIIPSDMRMDIIATNRYMEQEGINVAFFTTQIGYLFATTLHNSSLRFLATGGEKLMSLDPPPFRFDNFYGPTECTVIATAYEVEGHFDSERSCIGRPVAGARLYVVDSTMHLVPQGMAGELLIAGNGVGRGYLNRPELTAERFIDFCGERAYRTGDLVRWSDEGNIEFIGRIDGQVKMRGLRIELGEIEAKVATHPAVIQCAAAVKEKFGTQHLCCYYTTDDDTLDGEQLKAYLKDFLTDFLIPTVYMRIDAIPLTSNGKTNRRALPEPEMKVEEMTEAETDTEKRLVDITASLLNHREFGVTTNLIGVGLSSLMAMKMSAMIQNELNMEATVKDILLHPTLRDIAALIDSSGATHHSVMTYERRDYYPVTENQRGVYLNSEMNRDTTQYNIPSVHVFHDTSAEALAKAVKATIEAHPSLKAHFSIRDGEVVQLRRDDQDIPVSIVRIDHTPDSGYFQQLVKPFSMLDADLCRFVVVESPSSSYLFCDIHHSIFDGASAMVFVDGVKRALAGETLPAEEYTMFDHAINELSWMQSDAFAEANDYFAALTDKAATAKYPYSANPDTTAPGSATVTLQLCRTEIEQFCHANGFTANSFFMTLFAQTLHRLTREERLLFTSIHNGRDDAAMQYITGMFVKTLPVVSEAKSGDTIASTIAAMQQSFFETVSRCIFPYSKVVDMIASQPEIMFIYQGDMMASAGIADGNDGTAINLSLSTAKFPLAVQIATASDSAFDIMLEYDTSLYSHSDILTLAECFRQMCLHAVEEGVGTIADIKMVSAGDEERLLSLSYGGSLDYDTTETFVDMVQRNSLTIPDACAVADCEGSITYGELERQASGVAGRLIDSGVTPGSFVGIMLPRRNSFVVALLGVMKAGAAYIPLDNEYPADRLQYMLDDSKAQMLITTRAVYEKKHADDGFTAENLLFIDELQTCNDSRINLSTTDGLAYMIYTSGSTGLPKGVMIPHRALRNLIACTEHINGFHCGGHYAIYPSFSFDASVYDLTTSLAVGGCTHIIAEEVRKDISSLARYITDNHINGMTSSTAFGMLLLNEYPDLPLDFTTLGGEKLLPTAPTNIRIYNGYGPTEFTVMSSIHLVDQQHDVDIPIGRPLPNTYSYICDTQGHLLPQGMVGELCLEGPQIARGYWQRDELTAQRFVSSPRGERMYRTGDLARYNADGELEFFGRIDNQVKLRGFRIELGEIEQQIAAFPGITMQSVQVKEVGGQKHLCAYYTADTTIDSEALHAHLAAHLSDYMVPSALMQLPEIPLTPNGKVDGKALPQPVMAQRDGRQPQTDSERLFCSLFADVLHIDTVYADDNFFRLGGTSLVAMHLVTAAYKAGVEITYSDVFDKPTPEMLAKAMNAQSDDDNLFDNLGDYDYTAINGVLAQNTLHSFLHGERHTMRNILLTGATGFLGIHILNRLLTAYPDTHVYCLTRGTKDLTAEQRLSSLYFYYFSEVPSDRFGGRITIIDGDITSTKWFTEAASLNIDTVVNCAANVKHFSQGNDIEEVNYHAVLHLMDFCERHNALLVQVSTYSVAGVRYDDDTLSTAALGEDALFVGQIQLSKYTYAKFLAERAVLQAVAEGRLAAKIMRVGNLSPRDSDGEFQANMHTNSSMSRIRATHLIGCHSYEAEQDTVEFSPIDSVAQAILLLTETPRANVVFHPYNNHIVPFADIVDVLNKLNISTKGVEPEEYERMLAEALEDKDNQEKMTGLLAYQRRGERRITPVSVTARTTLSILYRLNMHWPPVDKIYVESFIRNLDGMGYFE